MEQPAVEFESRSVGPDGVQRLRADDGIRTRDPHLGKVMLYQLSHVRTPALGPTPAGWCPACEQNCSRSWPVRKLGWTDWCRRTALNVCPGPTDHALCRRMFK